MPSTSPALLRRNQLVATVHAGVTAALRRPTLATIQHQYAVLRRGLPAAILRADVRFALIYDPALDGGVSEVECVSVADVAGAVAFIERQMNLETTPLSEIVDRVLVQQNQFALGRITITPAALLELLPEDIYTALGVHANLTRRPDPWWTMIFQCTLLRDRSVIRSEHRNSKGGEFMVKTNRSRTITAIGFHHELPPG